MVKRPSDPSWRMARTFPAAASSAPTARSWALSFLIGSGAEVASGDVALVMNELVAHAVRHSGGGPIHVLLERSDSSVQIEVSEIGTEQSEKEPNDPPGFVGTDLAVVDEHAANWGVHDSALGKTVWAAIRL